MSIVRMKGLLPNICFLSTAKHTSKSNVSAALTARLCEQECTCVPYTRYGQHTLGSPFITRILQHSDKVNAVKDELFRK